MIYTDDTYLQFASYFNEPELTPYLYLLSKNMAEGSICLDLNNVQERFHELPEQIRKITSGKIPESKLVGTPGNYLPFIKDNDRLYLQRYYNYETQIIERIKRFIAQGKDKFEERKQLLLNYKSLLIQLFDSENKEIDWQYVATINALLNNWSIITGGPGTGKTTTVAKILSILLTINPQLKTVLAAPTGKAAARMAESLSNTHINISSEIKQQLNTITPLTVHRLLGPIKGSIYFKHNEDNPINADVVIIDECSMIDAALFAKLLSAIGNNTRTILLGDKDQLSSVEAGSFFGDICQTVRHLNSFTKERIEMITDIINNTTRFGTPQYNQDISTDTLSDNIVQLQISHRFNEHSGIGKLSKAIITDNKRVLEEYLTENSGNSTVLIDNQYSTSVLHKFLDGYAAFIQEENTLEALRLLDKQRILCAVKEGESGVYQINNNAETYLSKKIRGFRKDGIYYHNRPVIVTQNNYTLGLFNGDIGIIRKDKNNVLKAWFYDNNVPDKLKSVQPGLINSMETVFAMTIHKSQGSEFDNVMIILPPNADNKILTRELLYTGVTRARLNVWIQSCRESLLSACNKKTARISGITNRL